MSARGIRAWLPLAASFDEWLVHAREALGEEDLESLLRWSVARLAAEPAGPWLTLESVTASLPDLVEASRFCPVCRSGEWVKVKQRVPDGDVSVRSRCRVCGFPSVLPLTVAEHAARWSGVPGVWNDTDDDEGGL